MLPVLLISEKLYTRWSHWMPPFRNCRHSQQKLFSFLKTHFWTNLLILRTWRKSDLCLPAIVIRILQYHPSNPEPEEPHRQYLWDHKWFKVYLSAQQWWGCDVAINGVIRAPWCWHQNKNAAKGDLYLEINNVDTLSVTILNWFHSLLSP